VAPSGWNDDFSGPFPEVAPSGWVNRFDVVENNPWAISARLRDEMDFREGILGTPREGSKFDAPHAPLPRQLSSVDAQMTIYSDVNRVLSSPRYEDGSFCVAFELSKVGFMGVSVNSLRSSLVITGNSSEHIMTTCIDYHMDVAIGM
jgi:hypothetical protein